MLIPKYEDFLLRRCAVCSMHLETSSELKDTIQLSKYKDSLAQEYSKIDCAEAITSIEAICYIFGVSKAFLTSKLIRFFKETQKPENNNAVKRDEMESFAGVTKIVFCNKCERLVTRIYRFQKYFKSVITENSLIFNTLGKDFYKDEKNLTSEDIKSEQCDFSESESLLENDTSEVNFENPVKMESVSDNEIFSDHMEEENFIVDPIRNSLAGDNCRNINLKNKIHKQDFSNSKILVVPLERLKNSVATKQLFKKAVSNKSIRLTKRSERTLSKKTSASVNRRRIYAKKEIKKEDDEHEKLMDDDAKFQAEGEESKEEKVDDCESSDDLYTPAIKRKMIIGRKQKPNTTGKTTSKRKYVRKKEKKLKFVCFLCKKSFSLQTELESHTSSCHPNNNNNSSIMENELSVAFQTSFEFCNRPYFCRACSYDFQDRSGILSHNRLSHGNVRRYDCKYCEESFGATAALIVHLSDIHKEIVKPERDEDQHTCVECGTELYTSVSMVSHTKTTGHTKYISKCSFCEETFTERKKLKLHKQTKHSDKVLGTKSVVVTDSLCRKLNKEKLAMLDKLSNFQCPFCDKQFRNKQESDEHKLTHDKNDGTIYRCPKCPKSFTKEIFFNRHRLLAHNNVSNEPKIHRCERCGKTFQNEKYYRRHMKEHVDLEKGERPVCHICGNTFKAACYLRKHINVIHLGKESQQCDKCGYVARTSWDMKCHIQVHQRDGKTRRQKPNTQLRVKQ